MHAVKKCTLAQQEKNCSVLRVSFVVVEHQSRMLMAWLKLSMEPDILPTTVQDTLQSGSSASSDVINWIRSTISSASDTLRSGGSNSGADTADEDVSKEDIVVSNDGSRKRNPASPVGPVSFPAFLNSDHTKKESFEFRRASLVDGLEQTMDVAFNGRTVLALPLKGAKKKLNRAFKNLMTSPSCKIADREKVTDEESGEQSLLPIPIYSLPHTKPSTGSLLDASISSPTPANYPSRASTATSVAGLVVIFLAACTVIGLVYNNFPELSEDERGAVKLPKNIEDAKELGRVLSKYKNTYHYEVMSAFFITYIFLQTFAIPGSVFLSILSGFMYPFYIALFLVCLCSGIGATGCYAISYFVGKPLVHKYLAERVRKWNEVVDGQREHLFNYLLFLRITPFLPNWFINIVSPVIEIPVSTFFIATFFGVAPLSFIAIQAGTTLYKLTTAGDAISWAGIGVMGVLAVLSLLPVLLKNKLKRKFE